MLTQTPESAKVVISIYKNMIKKGQRPENLSLIGI